MAGKKKLGDPKTKAPMLLGGLDLDDIDSLLGDGSNTTSSGNRTPGASIRKLTTSSKNTLRDRVTAKSVLAAFARTALPDGYTRLLGLYDEARLGVQSVVDGVEQTEYAALEKLTEQFQDHLPKLKGKVSDAVYERIKQKIEERKDDYALRRQIDQAQGARKRGDYDETSEGAQVQQMLDNMELDQLQNEQAKAASDEEHNKLEYDIQRDSIQARLDKTRFNLLNRHLGMIADASQRSTAYNDTVTYQFQKKALELNLRQYLVQRNLLKVATDGLQLQREAYTAIVHNTSLTEEQKTTEAEKAKWHLKQQIRNPFHQLLSKTAADAAANFLPNLFNNIGSKTAGTVRGTAQAGTGLLGMLVSRLAQNPEEAGGQMLGEGLAHALHSYVIPYAARKIRPAAQAVSDRLTDGADSRIAYNLDNMASIAQDFANDPSQSTGMRGKLQGLVRAFAPQFRVDDLVKTGTYQTIDKAASFNQMSQRSIVEVIPGYLARILQETRMIRTGDHTVGREVFDITRGQFVQERKAQDNLAKRIVSAGARRSVRWSLNNATEHYDDEGVLSPEAKHALEERLLRDAMEGRHFDPVAYTNVNGYAPGTDPAVLNELEQFFKAKFKFDANGKLTKDAGNYRKRQEYSQRFNELRDTVRSPIAEIERLLRSGNHTALRDLGIIKTVEGEDRIDFGVLRDMYRDLGDPNGGPGTPPPAPPGPTDPIFKNLRRKLREAKASARKRGQRVRQRAGGLSDAVMDNLNEVLPESMAKLDQVGEHARNALNKGKDRLDGAVDSLEELLPDAKPDLGELRSRLAEALSGFDDDLMDTADIRAMVANNHFKAKDKARALKEQASDLIVAGQSNVAVKAEELLNGDLIDDTTKKVIKQLQDIKGEVIDRTGKVRLTAAEVANGIVTTADGRVHDLLKHLPSNVPANVLAMLNKHRLSIGNLIRKEDGIMSRVKDLYLEGANDPIIKATALRAGEYIDVATQKVLETVDDITGAVVHRARPQEVLFTAEEAAHRLVDNVGNRFKSSKLLSRLAYLTGKPLNVLGGAAKIALALGRKTAMFFGKRLNMLDAYLPLGEGRGQPVLLASKLKRGEYYNADGRVLTSFDDVRDGVYGPDGNLLVSEEDVANLVNRDGTKHTAAKQRSWLRRALKKTVTAPLTVGKWAARKWWGGTKAYYKGMGKMAANKLGLTTAKADKYNQQWLTPTDGILGQILGVLDKRLPKEEAREGSWQQKLEEAKAAAAAKKAGKAQEKRDKKMAGGGILAGLKNLFGKKKDKDEEEDSGPNIDINYEGGGDKEGGKKRKKARKKPPGRLRRGWDKLAKSRVGKAIGRNGGSALLRGAGSVASGLGTAARVGASALLGGVSLGGIGTGLSALGGVAATAGSAILGVLASPVVLGALAVGAAGAGGYWLWNRSKRTSGEFRDLRMQQYGISSTSDKLKVLELEAYLEPYTSKTNDPQLNIKGTDPKRIFEIMDIDPNDPEAIVRMATWLDTRFKPVYCAWMRAMFNLTPHGTLINELEDKLPDAAKYDFFTYVKAVPEQVYKQNVNPFDEEPLEVEPAAISAAMAKLIDTYRDKAKRKEDPTKTADTLKEGGVPVKPNVDKPLTTEGKPVNKPEADDGLWSKIKAGVSSFLPGAAMAGSTGALIAKAREGWAGNAFKQLAGGAKLAATPALLGGLTLVSAVSAVASAFRGDKLTALQAIRVRAYGKMSLDAKTAGQLFDLEELVYLGTKYTSRGQAYFEGDLDQLIGDGGKLFGVDVTDATSRKAQEFTGWVLQRFVPVALAYFASIRSTGQGITPSRVESAFDDAAKLRIANALMSANFEVNGDKVGIWKAPTFFNNGTADLGALRAQAEVELRTLKDNAEKAKLASPGTTVKDQENQEKAQQKTTAEKILEGAKNFGSSLKDSIQNFTSGVSAQVGGAVNKVKDFFGMGDDKSKPGPKPANSAYSTAYTPGGAIEPKGSSYSTFAEGNGGVWTQIPLPKAKTREGAMPTLLAVQAMTGADAEILATFASMESNFDYAVKAKTSSATGWFQFINSTWDAMLANHGSKYGIPPDNADRYLRKDPRINALMGAEFIKYNYKSLAKRLGRAPTDTDLYFAHFLGDVTAAGFLKRDRNAIAASLYPSQAAANRSIFYKETGQARTIGEVYQIFDNKVRKHRKGGSGTSTTKAPLDGGAGQQAIDQKAQQAAMSADMKPTDQGVNGTVGVNPQSTNPNDTLAMAADKAAAPMRMGDATTPSGTAPTTASSDTGTASAPSTASDNSSVVGSGQNLPERKAALNEALVKAQQADRAASEANQQRQQLAQTSQQVFQDQLETQKEMRDLLKTIAQKIGTPVASAPLPKPVEEPKGNDMGNQQPRAERRPGNAPTPISFSRS